MKNKKEIFKYDKIIKKQKLYKRNLLVFPIAML